MDSQIKPTEQADQRCDPDSDQRTFLTNEKKNGKGKASVGKKAGMQSVLQRFCCLLKLNI